ncbi:hypothetical protein K458DRAFT_384059 [Lentithecium fluviatile CBS 122367]|uniref:Uncharacterized protein n=1 Tax=Lentithecium fluviatile CBS 122367 TaxID=1168545 RepID=A0A6G1JFT5_9PLEO|nr:hypothetical protein K458DRAFT_384059 [Lentithecium fluviatile CBS 122367]
MDEGRASRWRWGLYTACSVDSIFIPLVGGVIEGTAGDVAILVLYIAWALLLGLFGNTFFERSSQFIVRCFYYLLCSALPLAFFGSFNGAAPHLWLPISSCIGIFIGVAFCDFYTHTTRRAVQRLRRKLLQLLNADEPSLPRYQFYFQPSTTVRDVATGSTDHPGVLTGDKQHVSLSMTPEFNNPVRAGTEFLSTRPISDVNERPCDDINQERYPRRTPAMDDSSIVNPWADN